MTSNEPCRQRIGQRLPNTLLLAGVALGLSIMLGVPMGVLAALRRNSLPDFLVALVSVLGVSVPAFWLGIMLILTLSVNLNWLPSSGIVSSGGEGDLLDRVQHLLMPALVLSTTVAAVRRALHPFGACWKCSVRTTCAPRRPRAWRGCRSSMATRCAMRWCPW